MAWRSVRTAWRPIPFFPEARPSKYSPAATPIVLLSGVSSSGKTYLAWRLTRRMGLPLLSVDTIKEVLADVLGLGSPSWSEQLGTAGRRVLVAIARQLQRAIVDAYWRPLWAWAVRVLDRRVVEIFCECPPSLLGNRLEARHASRHAMHLDITDPYGIDSISADAAVFRPVTQGSVLRIYTSRPLDVAGIACQAREMLGLDA